MKAFVLVQEDLKGGFIHMLQRGSCNTLYKNKEGEVNIVNIVMIKNIFFYLIYISLSNDMSGNLNSIDEKQIKSDNSV